MSVLLSLATLLRAHKYDFLQSHFGPQRSHPLEKSGDHQFRVAEAPAREVSRSNYLEIPAPGTAALFAAGEKMLLGARRLDQPLSILLLHLHDLPELELVFGSDAADEAMDEALTQLMGIAGDSGFAARTAPDMFTLLMPMQAQAMVMAIQARLGKPCCIDFELEGREILLVPEVMVRSVGATESFRAAYATLCKDIIDARSGKQRPHRTPCHVGASRADAAEGRPAPVREKDMRTFFPAMPATIPVPLYAR